MLSKFGQPTQYERPVWFYLEDEAIIELDISYRQMLAFELLNQQKKDMLVSIMTSVIGNKKVSAKQFSAIKSFEDNCLSQLLSKRKREKKYWDQNNQNLVQPENNALEQNEATS